MPLMIDVPLSLPEDANPSYNWGSVLHGMLMERFSDDEKEAFHTQGLKPLSQYIMIDRNKKATWRICGLTDSVESKLKEIFDGDFNSKGWILKQKNLEIKAEGSIKMIEKSYACIAEESFTESLCSRYTRLIFNTPSSLKKDGANVIFPTTELIIKSLFTKWDAFSKGLRLTDKEICEQLYNNTCIAGYNLKSTKFELEGTKIPSFIGKIDIRISGPDALARLVRMLFEYSRFCGIGVKTALGMGGVEIEQQ